MYREIYLKAIALYISPAHHILPDTLSVLDHGVQLTGVAHYEPQLDLTAS